MTTLTKEREFNDTLLSLLSALSEYNVAPQSALNDASNNIRAVKAALSMLAWMRPSLPIQTFAERMDDNLLKQLEERDPGLFEKALQDLPLMGDIQWNTVFTEVDSSMQETIWSHLSNLVSTCKEYIPFL